MSDSMVPLAELMAPDRVIDRSRFGASLLSDSICVRGAPLVAAMFPEASMRNDCESANGSMFFKKDPKGPTSTENAPLSTRRPLGVS